MTCLLLAAAASVSAGCFDVEPRGEKLYNSVAGVRTIVVAPMMNLSAEPEVDMVEVTNAFGSELQQVQGVSVVPIGRVYQFLAANKMQTVGSPDEARELARKAKNWAEADRLRRELLEAGIVLEDTKDGIRWKIAPRKESS